ncbi:MAG TPA: hypothetical protein VMJ65_05155 [Solirubrobacteraceae bacterium]|nr:hypothetical protein [Solirubrobacteraceae bacterium]
MGAIDGLPPDEHETVELAAQLGESGREPSPLIVRLREGEVGPERAREVLRALAELDVDLLVQITLDGLISVYLEDPGLAHRSARVVRWNEQDTD